MKYWKHGNDVDSMSVIEKDPQRFAPLKDHKLCENCSIYNDSYVIICEKCINDMRSTIETKDKIIKSLTAQLEIVKRCIY